MAPQVEREIKTAPETAAEADVLREQLDYLIDHAGRDAQCGCAECQRYLRVRTILLEIFAEPPRAKVEEIARRFAKAA